MLEIRAVSKELTAGHAHYFNFSTHLNTQIIASIRMLVVWLVLSCNLMLYFYFAPLHFFVG